MKRSQFLTLVALLLIIIIISLYCCWWRKCGEDKKPDDKKPAPTTGVSSAVPLTGSMSSLVLLKDDYTILKGKGAEKIIFNFLFNDLEPNYPTLVAYGAKKKKEYVRMANTDSVVLTATTLFPLDLTAEPKKVLSNQEILIDDIESRLDVIFPHVPPANRVWSHILFIPQLDAKKNVYYMLKFYCTSTMQCPNQAAGDTTNPSPPKNGE